MFGLLKPAAFWLLGVVLPLVPFILFEIKNHFINTQAGWRFIFGPSSPESRFLPVSEALVDLLNRFSQEALVVSWALVYFLISLLAFSGLILFKRKAFKNKRLVLLILLVFLLSLLLVVAIIKGQIHLHYLGLLLPVFFIVVGGADYFWQKAKIFSLINLLVILLILFFSAGADYKLLFREGDNEQINRAKGIAAYIAQGSEDKNIFVTSLSGSPYAYNYRYYLYLSDFKTDSLKPSSVFAICEGGKCGDPEGHALWEIAQFGTLRTVSAKHVGWGVWVYELKAY